MNEVEKLAKESVDRLLADVPQGQPAAPPNPLDRQVINVCDKCGGRSCPACQKLIEQTLDELATSLRILSARVDALEKSIELMRSPTAVEPFGD